MPIEASVMMFCVVLCLIAVALARTEDVYDFTEFERSPMRLFIQGRAQIQVAKTDSSTPAKSQIAKER